MKDEVLLAALAGLLHDVGKFAQRAGVIPRSGTDGTELGVHGYHALLSHEFVLDYVPGRLQRGLKGVLYHHRPDLQEMGIGIVRAADHLATGERQPGSSEQGDLLELRLVPILSNVSLLEASPAGWSHDLVPLNVKDEKPAYPSQEKKGNYATLWEDMISELDGWKQMTGWDGQRGEDYFITLSAILCKYLWCVPSATPLHESDKSRPYRAWPDVSLYDHCRLASAIAACLAYDGKMPNDEGSEPVALLARGDFSGIQNFIYRISRPDSETEHIAKRLRGRSFYVQLLTEVVVDWILREIELPPTCAVYVGGGRFDLLLPLSARDNLVKVQEQLEGWLLKQFQGEIGVLIAAEQARPSDFNDMRAISRKLNEDLEELKRRKWQSKLSDADFFEPAGEQWHVCKICQLTPRDESDTCPQCTLQEKIGKHLPHARYLAYCYGGAPDWDPEKVTTFPDDPFGVQVAIVRHDDRLSSLLASKCRIVLYLVNDTENFIQPGIASSFRFLANTTPKAKERIKVSDEQPVETGDVLHFEAIASLSKGAKRIGILKADVDRLGLIMNDGLSEETSGKAPNQLLRPTLSRVASLSRMLDLFFAGYLNQVCQSVFDTWEHSDKSKVDGLFYIMYSGGDDLFIVGPWDQTLELALRIQQEFQAYSGQNPSLTLSAGYLQVRPRYPVQKFAELVDEAERLAKKERNQLAAFGEAMSWTQFKRLKDEAYRWVKAIDEKKLPGGLIYDLGGMFRQHRDRSGKLRPMWTPRLYYTLARRLKAEARQEFEEDIFNVIASGKTLVPVSIASLSIRERSE